MEYRAFVLFSILLVCSITAIPLSTVDDGLIDEEYETVHDRILAVNQAHNSKRELSNENKDDVFDIIEANNEKSHENLYQGDIQMDKDLEKLLDKPVRSRTKRNAVRTRARLWTSRVIPYTVPGYMSHIKANLNIAIAEIQKHTCLRFVEYLPSVHVNYITFDNQNGCSSRIGKNYLLSGKQSISIGSGCNFPGIVLHELLHALGFFHEIARSDRDEFVSIKWENIMEGYRNEFDKYSWKIIDTMGQNYDYSSIMHYGRFSFSRNGQPTIVAIGDPERKLGNANGLSNGDIIELNALYDCQATTYGWTKWSDFGPCDDNCNKTRERYCYHPGNMEYCGGNVNQYGIEKQKIECTETECLAHNSSSGNWGPWSYWSDCSAECDDGIHSRVRLCNNPAPAKYGKDCVGSAKEETICTMGRCNPGTEDTDFDDSNRPFGMWQTGPGSQLHWTRNKDFTQTMNTGPLADHTTGKGYYLYIESSGTESQNKAKLISTTLTGKPGGQCFKFFYNMYGKTIGSLEVALLQNGWKVKTLFYKAGDQGPNWIYGTASIDIVQGNYQIEIIGTVGDKSYSDIAIDDVYIDDGMCSCQDKYISCESWSSNGECHNNKDWMSNNCPRSCYICRKCEDNDIYKDQCSVWVKNDECRKNKKWMEANCRKSCNACVCEDQQSGCQSWATQGECDANPVFMHVVCKKACGKC